MVIGTPSSGLKGLPSLQRVSDADAWASAPSASMMYIALSCFSQLSMRISTARVTSTGESSFER